MSDIQSVIDFWIDDVGPSDWFIASDDVDEKIRERFSHLVTEALAGHLNEWSETAKGTLARILLLDQFPRNLYRGQPEAFCGDERARDVARIAVTMNLDLTIPEPGRLFFYLPFGHSENLADQNWSVALVQARLQELSDVSKSFNERHRETIRRFGRFPARNKALGRQSTAQEIAFLSQPGR